ncbi:YfbU family protein [Pseudomonas leptonychotis]|uniref:YfbU family protein n=1 Tax=Pseudomonas leptonychotis TaxID=2448482 RepID=UPI0039EFDFF1
MRNLELTDKERLILANQYEIMAMLNDDENYALMSETLKAGHKWLYDQYFESLSDNLPDSQVQYVLTILGIYGDLQASYEELTDKSNIDKTALTFPGFDGNNECELLSFTDSLIKHRRFESTLGKNSRNSHMPTSEIYARMIQRWNELESPTYPYDKETIQEILSARTHPENRK